jgi:hypothetical protein
MHGAEPSATRKQACTILEAMQVLIYYLWPWKAIVPPVRMIYLTNLSTKAASMLWAKAEVQHVLFQQVGGTTHLHRSTKLSTHRSISIFILAGSVAN